MNTPAPMQYGIALAAEIERNVDAALAEDVGSGDLTAQLVPAGVITQATVISREDAVLCGTAWFRRCFEKLDPTIVIDWKAKDGDLIQPGQLLCELKGPARSLLTGERTALNFLQMLSGVATRARQYADVVAGTRAKIVDTRKTLPGLRLAQKFAVKCGGGGNHRLGLYDAILIKENHILAAGSIEAALAAARDLADGLPVEIEVESLAEVEQALAAGGTHLLLDNFPIEALRQAVRLVAGRARLEASGGITLETLRVIAETGVDDISIGDLTKDLVSVDLSMRFLPA